jgi:uncharacterized Zn finger protein
LRDSWSQNFTAIEDQSETEKYLQRGRNRYRFGQ